MSQRGAHSVNIIDVDDADADDDVGVGVFNYLCNLQTDFYPRHRNQKRAKRNCLSLCIRFLNIYTDPHTERSPVNLEFLPFFPYLFNDSKTISAEQV